MSAGSRSDFVVEVVPFGSDLYRGTLALRDLVLRRPLGLVQTGADVAGEEHQIHIALIDDEAVRGTVLLKPGQGGTVKLRQMAVDPLLQGRGGGRRLVTFAEEIARERGDTRIELHARISARPFYEKLGYRAFGPEFTEVGLPHVAMAREL